MSQILARGFTDDETPNPFIFSQEKSGELVMDVYRNGDTLRIVCTPSGEYKHFLMGSKSEFANHVLDMAENGARDMGPGEGNALGRMLVNGTCARYLPLMQGLMAQRAKGMVYNCQ